MDKTKILSIVLIGLMAIPVIYAFYILALMVNSLLDAVLLGILIGFPMGFAYAEILNWRRFRARQMRIPRKEAEEE